MAALVMFDCQGGDFMCHIVAEHVWEAIMAWDGEPTDSDGWYVHVTKVVEDAMGGKYGSASGRTFGLQAGVPDHVRMNIRHVLVVAP